jgi:ubiquinone/menaquinone biosynthesis C-methylase UbiE
MKESERIEHERQMSRQPIEAGYLPTLEDYLFRYGATPEILEYTLPRIKGRLYDFLEIEDGDEILEVGCGSGCFAVDIAKKHDIKVWATDISQAWLDITRKRALENSVERKIVIQKVDAECLPFENDRFDKIVCSEVLEHIRDKRKALQEMSRVLKPKGILALSTPNKYNVIISNLINRLRYPFPGRPQGVSSGAYDRPLSPKELKLLLTKADFKIENFELNIFGPAYYSQFSKIPLIEYFLKAAKILEKTPLKIFNRQIVVKARKIK